MLVFTVLAAILYANGVGVENLTGPADDTGFDASVGSTTTDLALRGTTDLAVIPPAGCTALALLPSFSTKDISIIPTFVPKELQVYSTTCPVASAYWKNAVLDGDDDNDEDEDVVVALEDDQVPLLDVPQVQASSDVAPPADVCVAREDLPVCDIDDRPSNVTLSSPMELGGGFSVPSVAAGGYVFSSMAPVPFGVDDFFTPDPPHGLAVRKTALDASRYSSRVYEDALSLIMDLYAGAVTLLAVVVDAFSPMVVLALFLVALFAGFLAFLVNAYKRKVSTQHSCCSGWLN